MNSKNYLRSRSSSSRSARNGRRFRPAVEALEDRSLPAAFTWVGPASGAWDNPANWIDGDGANGVPSSFDEANVGLMPGDSFTVTVTSVATCAELNLGSLSTLVLNHNLTVFGNADVDGALDVDIASVGITLGLDVRGSAIFDGSTTITGDNARLRVSDTAPTEINGPVFWEGGMLAGGSTSNPIDLDATMTLSGSTTKTLAGYLVNNGIIEHGGTGDLFLTGGDLLNAWSYRIDGDGDVTASSAQALVNSGTLIKSDGTGVSSVLFRNVGGEVVPKIGTLRLQFIGETTGIHFELDGGYVTMERYASVSTGVITGTYTGEGVGFVRLESGALYVGAAGATFDFSSDAAFEWTAGNLNTGSATLTNIGRMTITGGGTKNFWGTLHNAGKISHQGSGQLQIQSGTFENAARAVYDFGSDAGMGSGGTFVNSGMLRKGFGTGTSDLRLTLVNSGVIECYSGTFDFTDTDSTLTGGHFVVEEGATIKPPGGTYVGTFTGEGGIFGDGAGVVLMEHAGFTVGAAGATLDFPDGMLHWTTATIAGNGNTLTNAPTGTIHFTPASAGLGVNNLNFDNLGTVIQHGATAMQIAGGTVDNVGLWDFQSDGDLTCTGLMTNTGTLRKSAGTGTSSVSFSYPNTSNSAGTIDVLTGTMQFLGALASTGDVSIAAGATLRASGQYTQTAGTTLLEGGTLEVTGTAAANIDGGELAGDGTVRGNLFNRASVAPGSSPGRITVFGRFTQTATGVLHVELAGSAPGTEYDQLVVNGIVTLGGELAIALLGSFTPANGEEFTIIDNDAADAVTGVFATVTTGYRVDYASNSGIPSAPANNVVLTGNAAPTADAGGPYGITEGDALQLDASGSFDPDGDPLTYTWDLDNDGSFGDEAITYDHSVPTLTLSWADLVSLGIDDGPSTHSVRVQVDDGISPPVTSALASIAIANRAPTIALSGAAAVDEGQPFLLTLGAVTDPGNDTVTQYIVHWGDGTDNTYATPGVVAHVYADGQNLTPKTILVTLVDEDGMHPGAGSHLVTVRNVAPVASVVGPVIAVRGLSQVFTFSASDVAVDEAAGVVYTVDWDDGTPSEIIPAWSGNGAGIVTNHAYVVEGIYVVRLTATDKDGAVSVEATTTIDVRPAALLDDPLAPGQLMLVVGGTPGPDNIRLAAKPNPGDVRVRLNGVFLGPFQPTSRLVVHGYADNDVLYVNRQLTLPAWLHGGSGRDELTGGRGPNVLLGGDDKDKLAGRDARDLLIGGAGRDLLSAGGGSDLLIAGTTAFDADEVALAALQAEWLSARSYASRLANVSGDAANPEFGARQNGDVFLKASDPGRTVFDDGAVDTLRGAAGRDAFFANLNRTARDTMDKLASELAFDIE